MLIFGKNVFNELKDNNKIRKVYLSKKNINKEVIEYIKENKISYEVVDGFRLDKMVTGNHQGIVIEINDYDYYDLEQCFAENFVLILDHLEDPQNFGAIIRTCEAAGIKSIIIPKDRSVNVNGTVMKTSAGALNYVKVIMVNNLKNAIDKMKQNDFFVYGADMDGKKYTEVDYANKKVLVIGSEGFGLSRLVKEACDEIVSIPMNGKINSLNASVATGILIYSIK